MSSNEDAALALWAADAGCAEINIASSSEFVWVWMGCFMYAAAAISLALIPLCWFIPSSSEDAEEDGEQEAEEGSAQGSAPLGASEGEQEAHAAAKKISASDCKMKSQKSTLSRRRPASPVIEEQDPEPNVPAAVQHLRKTSPTDGNGNWRSVWGTRLHDMNEIGGTGMELYFRLLQVLGICFVVMSAFSLPIAAFSMRGNFAPDTGQVLAKTTIGNLANLPKGDLFPELRYIILGCQGLPLTRLTAVLSWLDFLAATFFLLVIAFFRFYWVPRAVAQDDAENITPADFAVEIEGLPPMIERQTEYRELLSKFLVERIEAAREHGPAKKASAGLPPPKVCELVLVRDYDGRLSSLAWRAKLLQMKAIATYKQDEKGLKKLEKKIEKITKRLDQVMKPEQELPVVRAYAILENTVDQRCLIDDYRFAAYRILRCCLSKDKRFHDRMLQVRKAPEPTDILWENQDMGLIEYLLRQAFVWFVFIVLLAVSLLLIYFASTAARQAAATNNSYLGVAACDPSGDPAEAAQAYKCLAVNATQWTVDYALAQGGDVLECFCSSKGHAAVIQDSTLTSACQSWLEGSALGIAIMGLASGAVVLINVVVKAILCYMASFERPTSMSALSSSMMVKVAVLQTINTVVVVTLVNYFGSDALRSFANVIPFGQLLFRGDFGDLTRGWYTVVGGAICMNMLVNSVTPGATNIVLTAFNSCWRRCRTKKQEHQAELCELYTNPPFDISARYAQLLTTVFCTLVYSSGLPLLTLFAAVYCFATYWSDKLVLLWGSQRPPAYTADMPRFASSAMLWSVGLHCAVAIIMYSQPCTFPSNAVGGALASASAAAGNDGFGSWLGQRISRETTWMFFALLLVLVALWACRTLLWILGGTFGEALSVLYALCCRRSSMKIAPDAQAADHKTWAEAAEHIERACPPASYRMDMRLEFKDLVKYLRDTESGVTSVVPGGSPPAAGENAPAVGIEPASAADGQPDIEEATSSILPDAVAED